MKISFLGDISLNDNYVQLADKNEHPFKNISPLLNKSDFVVGNLECLCEGKRTSNLPLPVLKTNLKTLEYLKEIPVSVVSLAANHVGDNYEAGFDCTIDFLKQNNIHYLGASYLKTDAEKPLILEKDGIKIALYNYLGSDFKKPVPLDFTVKVNMYEKEKIIADIRKLKSEVDHIVLIFHWGTRVEEGLCPDWYQMQDAKLFIDAGADIIIGHHSHTFQPYEVYKGKFIFYSLGNFCISDVHWNNKVMRLDRRRAFKSAIPTITFSKSIYTVQFDYIKNKNGFINPLKYKPFSYRIYQIVFPLLQIKSFWNVFFFYHRKIDWILCYFFGRGRSLQNMFNDLIQIKRIRRGFKKLTS